MSQGNKEKTTIEVPDAYLPLVADIRLLKSDEQNPNKMSKELLEWLKASIKKWFQQKEGIVR
jgi:hypothetical protein